VDTVLILLASLGTTYLSGRLTRRGAFTPGDLAIGLFAWLATLGLAYQLSLEGASWRPGLALLLACALTLGLEALRHRSPQR